jgi:hypothetical protein
MSSSFGKYFSPTSGLFHEACDKNVLMNVQNLYRLDAMGTVLKKLSIKRWEPVER